MLDVILHWAAVHYVVFALRSCVSMNLIYCTSEHWPKKRFDADIKNRFVVLWCIRDAELLPLDFEILDVETHFWLDFETHFGSCYL